MLISPGLRVRVFPRNNEKAKRTRRLSLLLTCRVYRETPLVAASLTNDPAVRTTVQTNIHVGQRLAREDCVRIVGSEPAVSYPLGKVCEIWCVSVAHVRLVLRGRHDGRSRSTRRGIRVTESSSRHEASCGSSLSISFFLSPRTTGGCLEFSRHPDENWRTDVTSLITAERLFDETFLTDSSAESSRAGRRACATCA